jgi:hypothetical protein
MGALISEIIPTGIADCKLAGIEDFECLTEVPVFAELEDPNRAI